MEEYVSLYLLHVFFSFFLSGCRIYYFPQKLDFKDIVARMVDLGKMHWSFFNVIDETGIFFLASYFLVA